MTKYVAIALSLLALIIWSLGRASSWSLERGGQSLVRQNLTAATVLNALILATASFILSGNSRPPAPGVLVIAFGCALVPGLVVSAIVVSVAGRPAVTRRGVRRAARLAWSVTTFVPTLLLLGTMSYLVYLIPIVLVIMTGWAVCALIVTAFVATAGALLPEPLSLHRVPEREIEPLPPDRRLRIR